MQQRLSHCVLSQNDHRELHDPSYDRSHQDHPVRQGASANGAIGPGNGPGPSPESQESSRADRKHSYTQILRSSALIGGSSAINIGIGIVRTKVMAILLGPAGFGLFGLYGSVSDLALSVAGMGVNSSGVRQIADAVGSGDMERIARTTIVLRRASLLLGVLGAALLALFSQRISRLTFGTAQHATAICLLGAAVLLRLISAGQTALIQGLRRISDLARLNVFGAAFGTASAIALVSWLGQDGIVLSLVAVSAAMILASWWYARKIRLHPVSLHTSQIAEETASLLKLGFAFMVTAMMTMGVAYLIRIIILHKLGFEATGLYQSAWTLGGLYISFILQAMGADFYPRLTASIRDHEECNRLVNEQMRIGLLLAGPGVIATLLLAPLVVSLFYSARFAAAVGVLRWICLGAMLQVVTWPMGFIIVAKARQGIFVFAELAWSVVAVGLALVCTTWFGVSGAGVAFFGSYVFHVLLVYPIVRRLTGFRCSQENARTALCLFSLVALVFAISHAFRSYLSLPVGLLALGVSVLYSFRKLIELLSLDQVPRPIRQLLGSFGYAQAQPALGQSDTQ